MDDDRSVSQREVALRLEYDPCINYAVQQNDVPVIRRLGIENLTDEPVSSVTVRLTTDPGFGADVEFEIDRIEPRSTYNVPRVDLKLSPSFLAALDEATSGHLWIEVRRVDVVARSTLEELPEEHLEAAVDALAAQGGSATGDRKETEAQPLPRADGTTESGAEVESPAPEEAAGLAGSVPAAAELPEGSDGVGSDGVSSDGVGSEKPPELHAEDPAVAGPPPGNDAILVRESFPIQLLAYDQWSGLRSLPEILAAFVLPNHPAVEGLLSEASGILEGWTGSGALDGYQSKDRERVWTIAAAVYAALQGRRLQYINPPASFERVGQKIRTPDRVFESGVATCLDLTLLSAAVLEQIGLHPVVAFQEGHAFPGFWLTDDALAEPAFDDVQHLRKRVDLGELCFFESTSITGSGPRPFAEAIAATREALADEEKFQLVVDLTAARRQHIRPLPSRSRSRVTMEEEASADELTFAPPQVPELPGWSFGELGDPVDDASQSRLEGWKRKLLDLSLRNRLLNFKESKRTLPLLCPDLGLLEDRLSDGKAFRLKPRPELMNERDGRDAEAFRERTGQDPFEKLLREALDARRLYLDLTESELERRTIEIYRAARVSREESGANTLYLALGFLHWMTPGDSRVFRAPILLVPIDLERKSVRSGFRLRLHDEDARLNVTLVQMLESDLGLQMPSAEALPIDESGVDVGGVLQLIRSVVRDLPGWEVRDEAVVGLFSFTKYLMWRDLHDRTEDLLENGVVEHLVERPHESFPATGDYPRVEDLDDDRRPHETFCPLSADSSQLAAVFAAADGRNFVLEGPPGTGKSQTITNLIAHTLAVGKRVLFVAEKTAALEVVQRRLERIGLGRFCLEIHSNKARKSEVLAQIGRALDEDDLREPEDWARQAEQLATLRDRLNQYARAIHREYPSGMTVFRATSRLIGLRGVRPVPLDSQRLGDPTSVDRDRWEGWNDVAARVATAGAACREVHQNPWAAAECEEWAPAWSREVAAAIETLDRATQSLAPCAEAWAHRAGLPEREWSDDELEALEALGRRCAELPTVTAAAISGDDWETTLADFERWRSHGRRRDELTEELSREYDVAAQGLDLEGLTAQWRRAQSSIIGLSWWRGRPVKAALRDVRSNGRAPLSEHVSHDLEKLTEWRDECRRLDGFAEAARGVFGPAWNEGDPDWELLERAIEWVTAIRRMATHFGEMIVRRERELARLAGAVLEAERDPLEVASELRQRWGRWVSEGRALFAGAGAVGGPESDGPAAKEMAAFAVAWSDFRDARRDLEELLSLDRRRAWAEPDELRLLERVSETVSSWRSSMNELRPWCAWRRVRREAAESGFGAIVEAYESGGVTSPSVVPLFERSLLGWWSDGIVEAEEELRQFFSPEHERRIRQFAELDDRFMETTQQLIAARLGARVPDVRAAREVSGSEVGLIQRELQKKRRHLPIRTLLSKTSHVVNRLKPCFLMSPLSVAQYLDPSFPRFDLVVFDEASQIPVWDAVGAIARGQSVVVVGDPKQLPPTSFFHRSDDEEGFEEEAVEDLESILEDCMGAGIPVQRLDWHYRSRHESLISFSNFHYYDNRLLTFPAPTTPEHNEHLGVSFRHVEDGVYDKGKSRTNPKEAEAVVAEVVRRLSDPELARATIGIVTFSQPQQTRIEDLLEEARRAHPEIDPYFSTGREEPVFVKNLENVQGDERDVIFFSVCYGPDLHGKVSMNFGALNREGGERRLNVAITRARREVVVFSSIRGDAIDLVRTRARAVRDLKAFLEYAERGYRALAEAVEVNALADYDSPFEQQVCEAMRGRGWEVHPQVGAAGYRIDLAVVDPRQRGRYLLGVECDGATYHRAKTARDRDRLRQLVLEGLGWTLHRVWSTDWWSDPEKEIDRIVAVLEERVNEPWRESAPEAEPVEVEPEASEVDGGEGEGDGENEDPDTHADEEREPRIAHRVAPVSRGSNAGAFADRVAEGGAEEPDSTSVQGESPESAPESEASDVDGNGSEPVEGRPLGAQPYVEYTRVIGIPDEFYDEGAGSRIGRSIVDIVEAEGPIAEDLLVRRVARTWGFDRSGAKIRRLTLENLPADRVVGVSEGETTFYWLSTVNRAEVASFRTGTESDETPRKSAEIPAEEIAVAARHVIQMQIALPEDELCRETARAIGFSRVTSGIAADMQRGVDRMIADAYARREGERVIAI